MIIDTAINNYIDRVLIDDNAEHEALHEPSGKLSASRLYMPLRFQLFKAIGVPGKPMDAYVLGKFKRGRDVEKWFVGQLRKSGFLVTREGNRFVKTQRFLEYRNAIGYTDAIVDSNKMLFKQGVMPHEVKSVTNMKLKRIAMTEVDYHYKLQGCFYAMAMGSKYYAVDIVSAEDLRPNVYVFPTAELAPDVDRIIDRYEQALKDWKEKMIIPKFEPNPKVPWTSNLQYAPYEEWWINSPDEVIIKKLQEMKLI